MNAVVAVHMVAAVHIVAAVHCVGQLQLTISLTRR